MDSIDFAISLYSSPPNGDGLISALDAIAGSDGRSVRAIPFSSEHAPERHFLNLSDRSREVVLAASSVGVHVFRLSYKFHVNRRMVQEQGWFFVYEHSQYPGVYVALTIEGAEFFRHGLLRFLEKQHPFVVMPFVTHTRMRRLLQAFQEKNGFTDLIITRASQRLRLSQDGTRKRVMPMVSWPGMRLEEGFTWLAQNDGWFQSIEFEARKEGCAVTRMSLTRDGIVRADRLFPKAFESFVLPICKTHYENVTLFSRRGRREDPHLDARPLLIDFGPEQFADVSENRKFITAMRHLRASSVSVMHGNPYVNMSVLDYLDGSSFDVWVLTPSQMVVVPQLKATIASIQRLINHVFDTYAEGEVRDYSRE